MSVDIALRAALRKQIEADYNEHTMLPGNQMPKVRRLPSRSLALDYIMGGGYPFGMMTRLWGGFSSGKSLSIWDAFWCAQNFGELRYERLMHLASMAKVSGQNGDGKKLEQQAKREREMYAGGLKCLYINAEKTIDMLFLAQLGLKLDEDHLEVVSSTRIEEIGDIVQQALRAYHVIAIDSTTDTISVDELGHKDGVFQTHQTIGMNRARKWGINLDWYRDRMSPDNVLIYTSQIRSKIGMSARQKIEGEHAPGGNQLDHDASITLHFMKGGWLKRKPDGSLHDTTGKEDSGAFGRSQAAGTEIIVRCDKNKVGRSHRTCLMHHDKTSGRFDPLHDLEKFAKYFKVVEGGGPGGWYTLPNGERIQGLRRHLEEDASLVNNVIDTVMQCSADPAYEVQLLRSRGGPGELLADGVDE